MIVRAVTDREGARRGPRRCGAGTAAAGRAHLRRGVGEHGGPLPAHPAHPAAGGRAVLAGLAGLHHHQLLRERPAGRPARLVRDEGPRLPSTPV